MSSILFIFPGFNDTVDPLGLPFQVVLHFRLEKESVKVFGENHNVFTVLQVKVPFIEELENLVQSAEQFLAAPVTVFPGLAWFRGEIGKEFIKEHIAPILAMYDYELSGATVDSVNV